MLALQLQRLQLIDEQMAQLSQMIAQAMKSHQDAVIRSEAKIASRESDHPAGMNRLGTRLVEP